MKKYKVIKKEGVRDLAGELIPQGKTFSASPRSAAVQLQLRCKEIEKVEEVADPKPTPPNPSTVEEITAALKERGVKIPDGAKKADLEKLLAESAPK